MEAPADETDPRSTPESEKIAMFCQRLRKFLYAGALLVLAPFAAIAQMPGAAPGPAGPAGPVGDPCAPAAPATTTIRVCEWVPEQVPVTRTVYRQQCREECYTAYRCQMVPETRTCNVTCYRQVCETVMVPKTTCVRVPCVEMRTQMCTRTVCKQVTEMRTKCVDRGHYECREVPVGPSLFERLCHKNDCCNPCPPCPRTKTVRCWVPCMVTECYPVCRTVRVKECYPVTKQVCTYKTQYQTTMVPCTRTRCVPECKTVTYTCCKQVMVPYQAKRMVTVCVPCQETVTCCRMVPRIVEKQVPCCNPCVPCCVPVCCDNGCGRGHRAHHARGGCCN